MTISNNSRDRERLCFSLVAFHGFSFLLLLLNNQDGVDKRWILDTELFSLRFSSKMVLAWWERKVLICLDLGVFFGISPTVCRVVVLAASETTVVWSDAGRLLVNSGLTSTWFDVASTSNAWIFCLAVWRWSERETEKKRKKNHEKNKNLVGTPRKTTTNNTYNSFGWLWLNMNWQLSTTWLFHPVCGV